MFIYVTLNLTLSCFFLLRILLKQYDYTKHLIPLTLLDRVPDIVFKKFWNQILQFFMKTKIYYLLNNTTRTSIWAVYKKN